MNQNATLDVIDREGWRKELPLQRTIVHIGSDPRSDVVLEPARGGGVAPLHAQLIAANSGLGYQLVNLGDTDILLGSSGDQVLPPRSVTRLVDGLLFKLGEFTLIFHGGDEGPSEALVGDSRYIGLKLSLPQMRLGPKRSLEGRVTVSNLGDRSGVQFDLELEGMESDCFDIEPGPILAAGATKEVSFRLYHRGDKPLAGDRRVVIRATAPHAYPGEEMAVSQVIEILPLYRHSLRLLSPDRDEPAPQVAAQPAVTKAVPPPALAAEPSPQTEDWWTASPAGATEPKPRVPAARSPQTTALPSEATRPAAEAKPSVDESVAPAAPAAEPAPAPAAEVTSAAAEVTLPSAEEVPPRAEAAPPAEVAPPAPVMEQAAERVPRAEPAAVPPEKGWARLIRAIPFFRPKQAAPPPDVSESIVQPPAAVPATVEAGLLPVTEAAPAEEEQAAAASIVREQEMPETGLPPKSQEWPVEVETPLPAPGEGETTPAAEPISPAPAQEQWVPEAGSLLQPSSGGEPAAPPEAEGRRQSEVAPQAEEGGPPSVEVAPQEAPSRQRALKLKASPPPETKEVWAPPVEAGPAPAEDWWAAEEPSATRPVLKLKASPPAEREPKQAPVEAGPPPPTEDWWTAEAEADAEAPAEKRQVLKLKASPPPEKEADQAPPEGEPPLAEDWWTP